MYRRTILMLGAAFVLALVVAAPAMALSGKPSFSAGLYADGQTYGTKAAAIIPAATAATVQSYDKLFVITNGATGQLPVAEAAPGNPMFNGGRWYTHTVMWTPAGMAAHNGVLPVLMSYSDVNYHAGMGHLSITPGTFAGGPPAFFVCPLLPVK
jgi:hypothetical protein